MSFFKFTPAIPLGFVQASGWCIQPLMLAHRHHPISTGCPANAMHRGVRGLMLGHHLRRWPIPEATVVWCVAFVRMEACTHGVRFSWRIHLGYILIKRQTYQLLKKVKNTNKFSLTDSSYDPIGRTNLCYRDSPLTAYQKRNHRDRL